MTVDVVVAHYQELKDCRQIISYLESVMPASLKQTSTATVELTAAEEAAAAQAAAAEMDGMVFVGKKAAEPEEFHSGKRRRGKKRRRRGRGGDGNDTDKRLRHGPDVFSLFAKYEVPLPVIAGDVPGSLTVAQEKLEYWTNLPADAAKVRLLVCVRLPVCVFKR